MTSNMTPIDWAMRPLKKFADFSGRAPRAEYWWFYLFYFIAYIVASIIDSIVGSLGIISILLILGLLVPLLAAGVRRLHDSNRSGWWILAPLVPCVIALALLGPAILNPEGLMGVSMGLAGLFLLIGGVLSIVILVFLVLPGTRGPNRFGPDPYGADVGEPATV